MRSLTRGLILGTLRYSFRWTVYFLSLNLKRFQSLIAYLNYCKALMVLTLRTIQQYHFYWHLQLFDIIMSIIMFQIYCFLYLRSDSDVHENADVLALLASQKNGLIKVLLQSLDAESFKLAKDNPRAKWVFVSWILFFNVSQIFNFNKWK